MEKVLPHACQRAKERYGVAMDRADLQAAREQIQSGTGVLVRRNAKDDTELWLVRVNGRVMPAVYSPGIESIKTILPVDSMSVAGRRDRRQFRKRASR